MDLHKRAKCGIICISGIEKGYHKNEMRSNLRKSGTAFREKDVRSLKGQSVPILSVDPPPKQQKEAKEKTKPKTPKKNTVLETGKKTTKEKQATVKESTSGKQPKAKTTKASSTPIQKTSSQSQAKSPKPSPNPTKQKKAGKAIQEEKPVKNTPPKKIPAQTRDERKKANEQGVSKKPTKQTKQTKQTKPTPKPKGKSKE